MKANAVIAPSPKAKLERFVKLLTSHGFEAKVVSKGGSKFSKSKLCIEVSGYGMKDTLKLYKPLWKWEQDRNELIDTKHERRFSTVEEMVERLKEFYPKLLKCLVFVPPLAEAIDSDKVKQWLSTFKKRVLKFQQDLLELDTVMDAKLLGPFKPTTAISKGFAHHV